MYYLCTYSGLCIGTNHQRVAIFEHSSFTLDITVFAAALLNASKVHSLRPYSDDDWPIHDVLSCQREYDPERFDEIFQPQEYPS